jgi:rieske iron-sulfur protein
MAEHDTTHHQDHFTRRAVLQTAIGVGAGTAVLSTLYVGAGLLPREEKTPGKEPVATGDTLVYALGEKAGQDITLEDLKAAQSLATPFIVAYPKSPENVVKKDLPNNTIMVVLADEAKLSPATKQHASEGVVAYSAICKHLGCTISLWANNTWKCPCHGGLYDIYDQAKVLGGPVPEAVPQLPIKVEGGKIMVTGEFLSKPGADV